MPHSKNSQKKFSKAGMVLTEALVAVATLAMGVVALGTITSNAISTAILSKDYLIAGGLVKEGVEAVKDIRYTNWLLKPNSTATCWLRLSPSTDPNCTTIAATGNYIVALTSAAGNGDSWSMKSVATGYALNLDNTVPATANTPYDLYLDTGSTTRSPGYYASLTTLVDTTTTASKYYRSIKFTSVSSTSATFTVEVQWKDGSQTRKLNKTLTIYNYQ